MTAKGLDAFHLSLKWSLRFGNSTQNCGLVGDFLMKGLPCTRLKDIARRIAHMLAEPGSFLGAPKIFAEKTCSPSLHDVAKIY